MSELICPLCLNPVKNKGFELGIAELSGARGFKYVCLTAGCDKSTSGNVMYHDELIVQEGL